MSTTPRARLDRPRRQGGGHRAGAGDGRRAEGRQRPPRHRDEPGAGGVPAVPEGDAARPAPTRAGSPATASCCPAATRASRSTPSSTSAASASSSRTSRRCAPGAPRPRATPSSHHTAGVEVTTGPLGQGVANAVGMAMSGRRVHGLLDPDAAPGESLFDHHVYVICSDGDLEEGVSGEASSIAGTQELGNLTMIYDRNRISIEGDTDIAFTEDVAKRYEAYGWHVQVVDWTNGGTEYVEDVPALHDAITAAARGHRQAVAHRARHDHRLARAQRPGHREGARQRARRRGGRGHQEGPRLGPRPDLRGAAGRHRAHPQAARARRRAGAPSGTSSTTPGPRPTPTRPTLLHRLKARTLPDGLRRRAPDLRGRARRASPPASASGKVINAIAPLMPELWGGSADLAGSNNTTIESAPSFLPDEPRRPRSGRPTPTRAGCCTSASASTAWARS